MHIDGMIGMDEASCQMGSQPASSAEAHAALHAGGRTPTAWPMGGSRHTAIAL